MAKTPRVHPKLNRGYGWRPGLPTIKFPVFNARVEAAALPAKVDLRPQFPPVYDQGKLNCCTGNAWAGVVEFLLRKKKLPPFTPSRMFIYYNERVMDNDVATQAEVAVGNGAHVVSTQGCPHEKLWPYVISKFADKPPAKVYQDGLLHLAPQVQQVAQDLTAMKEVLASGLPVVIGFVVYESFESDAVTKTGIIPMPGHHEQRVGGHCVVLAGYDDSKSSFIVRNSWGASWGIKGYCMMPYAYLTNPRLAGEFWMATGIDTPPTKTS